MPEEEVCAGQPEVNPEGVVLLEKAGSGVSLSPTASFYKEMLVVDVKKMLLRIPDFHLRKK